MPDTERDKPFGDILKDRIGQGQIGGKASGFLRAASIIRSPENLVSNPEQGEFVRFPDSYFVDTELYDEFVEINSLGEDIEKCKRDPELFASVQARFIAGSFPSFAERRLRSLLQEITYPLAVRSSSVMEDREGTAFAGKYSSYFIANQGYFEFRLYELKRAIKKVFASLFNPSALVYRRKRGLIDEQEKMAVLVQKAVGRPYRGYFLPALAGVGFTQNNFCWDQNIRREDGLVRLVFGLGTRAVGRGYARLFSLGKPTSRPEGNDLASIRRSSQEKVDVLNLKENRIEELDYRVLIQSGTNCYPGAERFVSLANGSGLRTPATRLWDTSEAWPILTFDHILQKPWYGLKLPALLRSVFRTIEDGFGTAMDIEFAVNLEEYNRAYLYFLQARPLGRREELAPAEIPENVPEERVVFEAARKVPSGSVDGIRFVVCVDPWAYFDFPLELRHELARVIGRVNRHLEDRRFVLIGPGRWGSTNVLLGVPVVYSEISNTRALVEVALALGGFTPEVSFGTHFFQDLVEDRIHHVALFPEEDKTAFNRAVLDEANVFAELFPDSYCRKFDAVLKVADLDRLSSRMNIRLDGTRSRGLAYLRAADEDPEDLQSV